MTTRRPSLGQHSRPVFRTTSPGRAQRLQAELAALLEQKRQLAVANGSLVSSRSNPKAANSNLVSGLLQTNS